jgi:hypothetical protein
VRWVIWLALPVGILIAAAGITAVLGMAGATDSCGSWLASLMPYCR